MGSQRGEEPAWVQGFQGKGEKRTWGGGQGRQQWAQEDKFCMLSVAQVTT